MKKLFWLVMILFSLAAMLVVVGCSDDETTTGSQDDPALETFTSLFENVDAATGELVGAPFIFFDTIATQGGVPSKLNWGSTANNETITLTWLASTNFWYCTAIFVDSGTTVTLKDSVQFRHVTGPVQYPNDDSLIQIISFATLGAMGEGIDTAHVYQNFTITHNPSTGSLTISGTGGSMGALTEDGCTVDWDYTQTFTGLSWYSDFLFDETSDELYCPYTGSIAYTGAITGFCTGDADTISGAWNVAGSFDNGLVSYEVTHDGTSWTITDSCETGFSEDLTLTDTLFVEDMFGDGAAEEFLNGFDLGFALMVEQGLMEPMGSPKSRRFGESALQDTVIVTMINTYNYTNGWHIFTFSAHSISFGDTTTITGIDSLKGLIGVNPVDTIVDPIMLDELIHHAHVSLSASGSGGSIEGAAHHVMAATINTSGLDTTVTFYGNVWDTLVIFSQAGIDSTCEANLALSQTVNHLVLNPDAENQCPLSGQVVTEFGIDLACATGNDLNSIMINGGWTVTVVANGNNTITVTYENDAGTLSWSNTGDCMDTNPSIMSISRQLD